jgi:hypothetical protein
LETLNQLEQGVLTRLLSCSGADFDLLRAQVPLIQVRARTHTGAGFYTDLEVPPGTPGIPHCTKGTVGTLDAECEGTRSGVGFLLFLRDGLLSQLECFTYAGEALESVEFASYRFETRMRSTIEMRCAAVTRKNK